MATAVDQEGTQREETTAMSNNNTNANNGGEINNNSNNNNGEGAAKPEGNGNGKDKPPAAKVSRRRTKTGCLTCRKRRIKCGEERPTCNNCIKSKRVCEGYNQRVVFKDGMNPMRQGQFPMGAGRFAPGYPIQPAPGPQPLQPIAPAPPGYPRSEEQFTPLDESLPPHLRQAYAEREQQHHNPGYRRIDVTVPIGLPGVSPQNRQGEFRPEYQRYHGSPNTTQGPAAESSFAMGTTQQDGASVFGDSHSAYSNSRSPSTTLSPASAASCPFNPPIPQEYMTSRRPSAQPNASFSEDGADSAAPAPESGPSIPEDFFDNIEEYLEQTSNDIDYDRESDDDMEEAESEDVEYRYGSQEDGMIAMETCNSGRIQHQQISEILRPFSKHLDEHSRVSFQSFLPDVGALTTYRPTLSSSPLMNPVTAKIFCHFVYVLGPRLHGPQNIWSYTIPMLSLSHPPLLHAILALSSLHISKLTKGADHPSLLHYHIALRRLGKAISSDRHRGHVATLAATLMLAYYETMAAEHDKWSSHIHGAKQLLKEVDFDRVARRVELVDEEESMAVSEQRPVSGASLLHQRRMRRQMIADDSVDDNFKSFLMGSKGRRQSKAKKSQSDRPFGKKELETLRLQSDLFWWYTKMDCYQSLLSGCPLVLDYIHWDQCPPRSRIGTLGTPYGSSDHYFLLLGRLCDFQVRDLARKKAVIAANGGQWIPPPEMGGPPRSHRPHFVPPQQSADSSPTQYGMIPTPNAAPRLPSAFGAIPATPNHPPSPTASDDLHTLTDIALQEWHSIKAAFEALQASLGPDYDPLPLEYMPVTSTPFGPALYYKSYSIASLQMLYSMALIVLYRCHPDMPPQSMMASSIQTRATAPHATTIARIVAGLVPTDVTTQINPALGASLIEASMPIFFAAVQYHSQDQRDWTVRKLREIHRLTGWATASRILLGCQRAWEMLAEKGRGPPYTRPRMEEEAEMFYEYHNYYVGLAKGARDDALENAELEGGADGARWKWKVSGRRTVDAAGILGERVDVDVDGLGVKGVEGLGEFEGQPAAAAAGEYQGQGGQGGFQG